MLGLVQFDGNVTMAVLKLYRQLSLCTQRDYKQTLYMIDTLHSDQ